MEITTLDVSSVVVSRDTQARMQTDYIVANEYAAAMKAGAQFPPIIVFFDGSDYWLADGFHRVDAAKYAGLPTVQADVRRGTKRDAVLYACSANAAHGVRRTDADKRRAVETLLKDEEWRQWSDHEIARRCAVTQPFVGKLRAQLYPPQKSPNNGYQVNMRKGADGKTYNTANIGKPAAAASKPPTIPIPLKPAPVPAGPTSQWVGGEPKPYPPGTILPNGHSPTFIPARLERVEVAPEPEPEPAPLPAPVSRVTIVNADAQQVGELVTEPVHLVVTSPPYNVGIDYDQHNDNLLTYLPMLGNVWRGCHQVMADGARIAVVVPFGVGRNPYVPFDCQIMQTLVDAGFTLRGRIVWDKNTTGNRTSWGSYRLPSSPSIRDTTECIIVAHKGGDALEIPAAAKLRDEKGTHTAWLADGDYFMGLAQDHWVVSPESAQRVKHPAPYPVELVTRLIHFYAFPGAHILDPFGGSGTTGIAARRLGCDATLIELSADYCQLAKGRIDGD
jgi:DNA modification methylase